MKIENSSLYALLNRCQNWIKHTKNTSNPKPKSINVNKLVNAEALQDSLPVFNQVKKKNYLGLNPKSAYEKNIGITHKNPIFNHAISPEILKSNHAILHSFIKHNEEANSPPLIKQQEKKIKNKKTHIQEFINPTLNSNTQMPCPKNNNSI